MRQVEFGSVEEVLEEPSIRWLIHDWLPERELTLLWGREGTFKSFIALDWALTLARAGKVVVYIAAEGLTGLRARVMAWMQDRSVGPDHLANWHYFNSNVYLNQPAQRKHWINTLKSYLNPGIREGRFYSQPVRPDLIVVDTLDRCYDGEENSSKELGHFIDGLEELRRELSTAVLLIHHSRKEGDRERGTTALPAAVFASHHVSKPTKRPSSGGGTIQVECFKMKDAEAPETARVQLEVIEFTQEVDHTTLDEIINSSLVVREWSRPPKRGTKIKTKRSVK